MSLDLLRERFGHSVNKKQADNKEKIHDTLNNKCNEYNGIENLKSFKSQHQGELEEKDRIIENLESEASNLANQVLKLEKEKSTLLENINQSQWLENTIASNTKKIYEDKIKKMSYVDSSELIPMLVEVARRKQGNEKLNWGKWLEIPENIYLFQINENIAKKVFEDTNVLIDEKINYLNKKRRNYGGDVDVDINYILSFTGDTNSSTRRGDLVATDFNPNDFDLNLGFTISYWVRPDELGSDMFAIGRKAHNHERWTFGISNGQKGYFGVGANQSERKWETMFDAAGIDKATHLTQDGDNWFLTIGKWYHFAVTYANRVNDDSGTLRKIYMNGQQIWGTGVSDGAPNNAAGNINWSSTGREMSKGMSFGMRAVRGSGTSASYNNGWACGLDEVAIYDEEKDATWISNVYNGGTDYDHSDATKSDNDSTAKAAGTSQRGLVGYWKFNEGGGTRVEDLSGFGNHGLLTNDTYGDDGGAAWVDENDTPTWEDMSGENR